MDREIVCSMMEAYNNYGRVISRSFIKTFLGYQHQTISKRQHM